MSRSDPDLSVYLNGRFVPAAEATVSVFDHGFLYGDGLFETVRAYGGTVFRPDAHFDRMARGATHLGFALPFDRPGFSRILSDTLERNGFRDALVRLTVSRGEGEPLPGGECGAPTVVAVPRPAPSRDPAAWEKGIAAVRSPFQARPAEVLDPGLKSLNFLGNVMALREARHRGADEAILLNGAGDVAEGSISNVFAVTDGAVLTPPEAAGILPGVTREAVLELAGDSGLPLHVVALSPARLKGADEVFVTNSGWEVMPVTRLDGEAVGGGKPGPVTRRLFDAFCGLVGRETGSAV